VEARRAEAKVKEAYLFPLLTNISLRAAPAEKEL